MREQMRLRACRAEARLEPVKIATISDIESEIALGDLNRAADTQTPCCRHLRWSK